jgi:hypothetical protein
VNVYISLESPSPSSAKSLPVQSHLLLQSFLGHAFLLSSRAVQKLNLIPDDVPSCEYPSQTLYILNTFFTDLFTQRMWSQRRVFRRPRHSPLSQPETRRQFSRADPPTLALSGWRSQLGYPLKPLRPSFSYIR